LTKRRMKGGKRQTRDRSLPFRDLKMKKNYLERVPCLGRNKLRKNNLTGLAVRPKKRDLNSKDLKTFEMKSGASATPWGNAFKREGGREGTGPLGGGEGAGRIVRHVRAVRSNLEKKGL